MKNIVASDVNCSLIAVEKIKAGDAKEIYKSRSNRCIHTNSLVVATKALYFASTDDLQMVCCFFAFQEIRVTKKYTKTSNRLP